ncbi:MAG: hypothetical protein V7636_2916, partial [Actinomycetota bacterium]
MSATNHLDTDATSGEYLVVWAGDAN